MPPSAAVAAYKAFREAEARLGVPASEVLRMPKADDPISQKAFWEKLGTPVSPDGYKLSKLAFSDGTSPEPAFQDAVHAAAMETRIPASMLEAFMTKMLPHMEQEGRNEQTPPRPPRSLTRKALEAEWGADLAKNKFAAGRAMDTLGVPGDVVEAMQGALGYQGVMNHFLKLANMMGEGRFVEGGGHTATPTKEGATAQLKALMSDPAWAARWASGGAAEIKQKSDLIAQIVGAKQ